MEQLLVELQGVIDRTLPEQVGSRLKERLIKADLDAGAVQTARAQVEKCEHQIKLLKEDLAKHGSFTKRDADCAKREATVADKEAALAVAEARCAVKNEQIDLRVGDLKEIVRTVFQSNRIHYSESRSGMVPVVHPQYGVQQSPMSETRSGEIQ